MNIFKHIATALYKSLYDFKWIALQRQSLVRGLVYFAVFFFVVVGVRGWFFMKDAPAVISGHWETLETELPDFTVEKNDDGLSFTGIEQPFVREFEKDGENVIVHIDTASTSSISVDDVLGENTDTYAVVVTSKKLKFYDPESGHTDVEDVTRLPNFSYTKAQIGVEVTKWTSNVFPWVFVAAVFFFTLFLGVGKLVYLVILAWFVHILARVDKKDWKFGQVFTIGLYALTLPILVEWGISLFFHTSVPILYSALSIGIMYMVVYKGMGEKKTEVPKVPEPPKPPKKK